MRSTGVREVRQPIGVQFVQIDVVQFRFQSSMRQLKLLRASTRAVVKINCVGMLMNLQQSVQDV